MLEMRALVCWLVLAGCSGQNVVAGDGKSKAEKLQGSLPSWCTSICQRLAACDLGESCGCTDDSCVCGGVGDDCPGECQAEMARYTVGDDECAEAGARFQGCVDQAGCAALTQEGLCSVGAAEEACPRPGDPDVTSTGGPNVGTDGGASYGPPAPVTCGDGFGSGGGTSTAYPAVVCEQGHQGCSDGHEYRWYCVRTSETVTSCSCLLDEQVVGGFDPGEGCPSVQQVNQGCGWNLDLDT